MFGIITAKKMMKFFRIIFFVCPFDFSSFNFFPKIGKALFCRLSERDFQRNPFHKEKAAAEAPLPPSLNGQLSVISQIFFFYRKRQMQQLRSRKQRVKQSKEPSCCYFCLIRDYFFKPYQVNNIYFVVGFNVVVYFLVAVYRLGA